MVTIEWQIRYVMVSLIFSRINLFKDTVTFSEGGQVYNGTNVVIEDIWEDLMADSHQYKKSGKKYFYWEVSITNDEDELITIKFECP